MDDNLIAIQNPLPQLQEVMRLLQLRADVAKMMVRDIQGKKEGQKQIELYNQAIKKCLNLS